MPARPRRHRHELALRAFALTYPETQEDFPWGHRALKVRGKIFAVMGKDEPALSLSVKLPFSAEGALQLPFCEPTHYGLGRSGWVTATFAPRAAVPLDVLRSWIDESYRAVAPKRLVRGLAARAGARLASSATRAAKRLFGRVAARPPAARSRARASAPSP
ncbi:MAG TPA: MmcQ/YjbR family DNA-binding protein [Anaeromyxobacter sp.]|nr:MmcQ/YjbR family DNA-binding protein [Anaeromyxobacter sp.]